MSHFGASGEGDFIDIFMAGKRFPSRTESGDYVDYSIRKPRFGEQVCEV